MNNWLVHAPESKKESTRGERRERGSAASFAGDYKSTPLSSHLHCLGICLETTSSMASPFALRRCFVLVALLAMSLTCHVSADIIERAMECFHDRYVYASCQADYRLNAEGVIHVPPEALEAYCGGPCLAETKLVLKCVAGIMDNFRFFNGASIRDIGRAITDGCGHGERRGNFGASEDFEGYGDYFDHGNKLAVSTSLAIIMSVLLLFWGHA